MANKEWERKERIGQQSQGNTACTQDPTSGYGLEKEPIDHVKSPRETLRRERNDGRDESLDDVRPNHGATEPMTQGSSPQRNAPSSHDSSQAVRSAASHPEQRAEGQSPARTANQGERMGGQSHQQRTGSQSSQPRTGSQGSQPRTGNQGSQPRTGNQGSQQRIGKRHDASPSGWSSDKGGGFRK